jgi:hypothetical protein
LIITALCITWFKMPRPTSIWRTTRPEWCAGSGPCSPTALAAGSAVRNLSRVEISASALPSPRNARRVSGYLLQNLGRECRTHGASLTGSFVSETKSHMHITARPETEAFVKRTRARILRADFKLNWRRSPRPKRSGFQQVPYQLFPMPLFPLHWTNINLIHIADFAAIFVRPERL